MPYQQGVFWGCLVALSASAIVLRIMQEKGTTNTPTGRLSLAILVFQDIMVAPMLLCVPLLSGALDLSLKEAAFSGWCWRWARCCFSPASASTA